MTRRGTAVVPVLAALVAVAIPPARAADDDFAIQRERMVRSQIEARGVRDPRVLAAMRSVPRHLFVPPEQRNGSYGDHPLPIGYGQTISQPYIVALMTELLTLPAGARVLEVGTGSGYQAAVLSAVGCEVYSVEIVPQLAERSAKTLRDAGYGNVTVANLDGYFGWEKHSPFDAIIVTAAAEFVPPPLVRQLKVGGVMCIPVGPPFYVQDLYLVRKRGEKDLQTNVITQVMFVPLTGGERR